VFSFWPSLYHSKQPSTQLASLVRFPAHVPFTEAAYAWHAVSDVIFENPLGHSVLVHVTFW
jgi:hypothetical protein